jgi:hypothetical protein
VLDLNTWLGAAGIFIVGVVVQLVFWTREGVTWKLILLRAAILPFLFLVAMLAT